MANVLSRRVTITEVDRKADLHKRHWRIDWTPEVSTKHPTAMDALNAVKVNDREQVAHGYDASVTTIEWNPRTQVGKAVVAAIVNAREAK